MGHRIQMQPGSPGGSQSRAAQLQLPHLPGRIFTLSKLQESGGQTGVGRGRTGQHPRSPGGGDCATGTAATTRAQTRKGHLWVLPRPESEGSR